MRIKNCLAYVFVRENSVTDQHQRFIFLQFLRDLDDEIKSIELQEDSVIRKLKLKGKPALMVFYNLLIVLIMC